MMILTAIHIYSCKLCSVDAANGTGFPSSTELSQCDSDFAERKASFRQCHFTIEKWLVFISKVDFSSFHTIITRLI